MMGDICMADKVVENLNSGKLFIMQSNPSRTTQAFLLCHGGCCT